jgi:hypothetical protein
MPPLLAARSWRNMRGGDTGGSGAGAARRARTATPGASPAGQGGEAVLVCPGRDGLGDVSLAMIVEGLRRAPSAEAAAREGRQKAHKASALTTRHAAAVGMMV